MDKSSTRRRIVGSLCALVVAAGFGMASSAQAASNAIDIGTSTSKIDPGYEPCAGRTN